MSIVSKKEISNCSSLKAISNVLGNLMKKPSLLKEYKLTNEDFPENFQRIIFTVITNLAKKDVKDIDIVILENYLHEYKVQYNAFLQNNGPAFIETIRVVSKEDEFEYYYNQLKKYTLLRKIMESGTDVSDYFDPKETNPSIIEKKQSLFENSDISEIMSFYRKKQIAAFGYFLDSDEKESKKAGVDGLAQKELWKQGVSWGLGYASDYLTSALYGLREGRFTIGSAGTGVGKTRMTLANLGHAFAPYYYNKEDNQWYQNPNWYEGSGALYIGTEMELLSEIEPIMWAYMANVPEDHIKENSYLEGEEERVNIAIEILDKIGNIYCEYVPNYDIGVLESIIENHKISHKINHVFFDYIHSTADLVNEYSSQASNKMALREDQILLNLSTKLKNMARKYNVSIDTWTQVSGDFKNEDNRDQTIVRGARAIIDKADSAYIASRPTKKELESVPDLITASTQASRIGLPDDDLSKKKSLVPNLILSLYKNRGGKYNNIKIWLNVDYNTMRVHDAFVTDYNGSIDSEVVIGLKKKHIDISTPDKMLREDNRGAYKIELSELQTKLKSIPWTKSNSEYKNSSVMETINSKKQGYKEDALIY